jgi:phage-related protein
MAARFFSKLKDGANKFFGKIRQDAPGIMKKISGGISDVGNFIDKGISQVSSVTNSPIAQAIAGGLGLSPELGMLNGALKMGQQGVRQGTSTLQGITAHPLSVLSHPLISSNMLQKAIPPQPVAVVQGPAFK